MEKITKSIRLSEDNGCCFRKIKDKGVRIIWEITSCCNLNCVHCMAVNSNIEQLDTEQCLNLIKQFRENDVKKVMITGGEPLVRKDIFTILEAISENGLHLDLNTNCTLIDESMVHKLKNCGLDEITTSLDGLEKLHDEFRGVKSSFKKTVNGIRLLLAKDIKVDVVCVPHKKNLEDISDLIDFLYNLGVSSLTFSGIIYNGRAKENQDSLKIDQHDMDKLKSIIFEKREKYKSEFPIRTVRLFKTEMKDECHRAEDIVGIDAGGFVHPCLLYKFPRTPANSIAGNKLADILNQIKNIIMKEQKNHEQFCG